MKDSLQAVNYQEAMIKFHILSGLSIFLEVSRSERDKALLVHLSAMLNV